MQSPLFELPAPAPGYVWSAVRPGFNGTLVLDDTGRLRDWAGPRLGLKGDALKTLDGTIERIVKDILETQKKTARLATEPDGDEYFVIPPDPARYENYRRQLAATLEGFVDAGEAERVAAFVMHDRWFRSLLRETQVFVKGSDAHPTGEVRFPDGMLGDSGETLRPGGFFTNRFGNLMKATK